MASPALAWFARRGTGLMLTSHEEFFPKRGRCRGPTGKKKRRRACGASRERSANGAMATGRVAGAKAERRCGGPKRKSSRTALGLLFAGWSVFLRLARTCSKPSNGLREALKKRRKAEPHRRGAGHFPQPPLTGSSCKGVPTARSPSRLADCARSSTVRQRPRTGRETPEAGSAPGTRRPTFRLPAINSGVSRRDRRRQSFAARADALR